MLTLQNPPSDTTDSPFVLQPAGAAGGQDSVQFLQLSSPSTSPLHCVGLGISIRYSGRNWCCIPQGKPFDTRTGQLVPLQNSVFGFQVSPPACCFLPSRAAQDHLPLQHSHP